MNEVPYIKLSELCSVNQGLQIPISKRHKTIDVDRYFYITIQFLKDSHNEKYFVENPPASSICEEDDILVVRTGSTGEIVTGVKGCFHNNFFKVNFDKEKVNGRYLYYCLSSKEKQKEMKDRSGITTIPDLNHFMFLDMKIPLPDYSSQFGIAKVVDSISSKIELNNKINSELESMAKLIYDYWFVQFDFPDENGKPYKSSGGKMIYNGELKREIPEGWKVKEIQELAFCIMGQSPKGKSYNQDGIGTPLINGPADYENGGLKAKTFTTEPTRLCKKDDMVLCIRATIGNLVYSEKEFCLGRGVAAVRPLSSELSEYVYYLLEREIEVFKVRATGSIIKGITKDDLVSANVPVPNNENIKSFSNIIKPYFDKIRLNKIENNMLTELRDWLLPMLMNGQVKILD